jgi:hypothetical protein
MARGDQLARQWKIIRSLISARRGETVPELAGIDEIKFWIMNWGSKAMVLEPESLKKEIKTEAEAMLQRYSKTE